MTSSIDCTAACFSVNLRQAVPHAELLVLGELLLNQNQFCAGTNVSALCTIPGHRDLPFSCFLLCSPLKHLVAYNSILETYMVSFLAMTSVRRAFRFSSMQPCSQTVLWIATLCTTSGNSFHVKKWCSSGASNRWSVWTSDKSFGIRVRSGSDNV